MKKKIFRALSKIKTYMLCQKYQATGLTPEEIMDGRLLTGWIPVEEKLPPEPEEGYMHGTEEYIVTIEGAIKSTFLMWYADDTFYDVLAWMPLPEAYKTEEGSSQRGIKLK